MCQPNLAEHFTIPEPQSLPKNEIYVLEKNWLIDFEATKLCFVGNVWQTEGL